MGKDGRGTVRLANKLSGRPTRMADLPPINTKRWVTRRKAAVVAAVDEGLISLEEACRRYALTKEEFQGWEHALGEFGLAGLRVTRTQQYRHGAKH
jgi:hypothetical protein